MVLNINKIIQKSMWVAGEIIFFSIHSWYCEPGNLFKCKTKPLLWREYWRGDNIFILSYTPSITFLYRTDIENIYVFVREKTMFLINARSEKTNIFCHETQLETDTKCHSVFNQYEIFVHKFLNHIGYLTIDFLHSFVSVRKIFSEYLLFFSMA